MEFAILLARIQFAITVGFHFIFPPLTIGLAWLIFWLMTRYKKSNTDYNKNLVRFWIKIFTISFAIGVATGIVMEFQFGTNWSEYSRFVGDIFGAPLAAEGIFAFFLESSFLAVLLFGWNRVSIKMHWFSSLMVAIGSTLSAFWIIVANSWQQTPAGYKIVEKVTESGVKIKQAILTDFWQAVFNPSTVERYLHTVDACLITGSFFMIGISAWLIIKKKSVEYAKQSLKIALIIGFIASVIQLPLGHMHSVQVAKTQPAKLAAFEGLFESTEEAPIPVIGFILPQDKIIYGEVSIPGLLSFLAYGDFHAKVKGLNEFPKDEIPPVAITFYSFHIMVGLGLYFILLTFIGIILLWRKKIFDCKKFLIMAIFSIPLPFIVNELGWIAAEVGRQPWVVYNELKTKDAVSISVSSGEILFSIILFSLIYIFLFILWIYLLKREIRHAPELDLNNSKGGAIQ